MKQMIPVSMSSVCGVPQVQDERAPSQEAGMLQAESMVLQNAQLQDLLDGCRRELADVYSQAGPMLISILFRIFLHSPDIFCSVG